jgi:microcystin-dependent protein
VAQPFLAEIRMFAGNFAPRGYALCNGQILPISQNTALFSLIGTIYGGNGTSNFALPNLQGCAPMHHGQGQGLSDRTQGEVGGEETVTLQTAQIPSHSHAAQCYTAANGDNTSPSGNVWGKSTVGRVAANLYDNVTTNPVAMAPLGPPAGSGQPHNNLMPYLVVTFMIALLGVFPARN